MNFYLTTRGFSTCPKLYTLSTGDNQIIDIKHFTDLVKDYIPKSKNGFSGLVADENNIYCAMWDEIIVLRKSDLSIVNRITSNLFSDLHGLDLQGDTLYVTSTNIDSVLRVSLKDGHVEIAWSAFNSKSFQKFNYGVFNEKTEYNKLEKSQTDLHRLHINSVISQNGKLYISFLGESARNSYWQKKIKKPLGLFKYREGGIITVDKKSKSEKLASNEGLHDPFFYKGQFYYTEYFGHKLLRINEDGSKGGKFIYDISEEDRENYLCRGVYISNNAVYIGFTTVDGWKKPNAMALLRTYDHEGRYINEIKLPGEVGVYQLIPCR